MEPGSWPRLGLEPEQTHIVDVKSPVGPGNAVIVKLCYQAVTEVCSAIGEVGKSGELVAREAADQARAYIASELPVGEHLADQLMVPLAILNGGRYRTGPLSEHSRTNLAVILAFGGETRCSEDGVVIINPIRAAAGCTPAASFRSS